MAKRRMGILIFLSLLYIAAVCQAGDEPAISSRFTDKQPGGRDVNNFLTPDGRFDLEAVRASGYQGGLDLEGVNVTFDPVTGEPMVRRSTQYTPTDHPDDVYWDNSISPSIPGVDGTINALTVYDGKLIVGGNFIIAGDIVAYAIAAWDGDNWFSLDAVSYTHLTLPTN